MSEEEKKGHYIATEKYRKKKPEIYRSASLRRYYADPIAAALKAKKYREENRDHIRTKQREDKRKRKLWAIEYLGGKCLNCGNSFQPAIYEFHHKDPNLKNKDPSKMLSLSMERLVTELDKCILLCANCHRVTHHKDY